MRSSVLARIPGFRQRIIPEPHVPSRGSHARGTRLDMITISFPEHARSQVRGGGTRLVWKTTCIRCYKCMYCINVLVALQLWPFEIDSCNIALMEWTGPVSSFILYSEDNLVNFVVENRYTCNFWCDFLLVMNDWMSYERYGCVHKI
jgi:hypothetical protein